jgi:hypothetical protein
MTGRVDAPFGTPPVTDRLMRLVFCVLAALSAGLPSAVAIAVAVGRTTAARANAVAVFITCRQGSA